MIIKHPIEPFYNKKSKILILGSFPSVKSREEMFFYGHPQNRFWRVVSCVFNSDLPKTIAEKKKFLDKNNIAVWDVISSCEIIGSSDSSIKNVIPNDISMILNYSNVSVRIIDRIPESGIFKTDSNVLDLSNRLKLDTLQPYCL